MIDLSAKAAGQEIEFIMSAMKLCEPLRTMPELWPMFEALEADAA